MEKESDAIGSVNRRSALRKISVALTTPSILASGVAANNGERAGFNSQIPENTQCTFCSPTVLGSSEEAVLVRIPNVKMDESTIQKAAEVAEAKRKARENNTDVDSAAANFEWKMPDYDDEFLARVNKKNRVIEGKIVPTKQLDELDISQISVNGTEVEMAGTDSVGTLDTLDEYVRDYQPWGEKFGTCGGYTADYHYSAGIAIDTGEAWSRLTGAVLGALLCTAVPGGWLAKLGSKFFSNSVCAAIGSEIYNWVGPSSANRFTYAMWDTHRGWGDIEHLVRGRTNQWTTTHTDLTYTYSVPSVHIGQVLDNPKVIL